MSIEEFVLLLQAAAIKYDRVELSQSPKGGYQACVRIGRALHVGTGVNTATAIDACIASAQLATRAWA